jgi:small GTP-binding protein
LNLWNKKTDIEVTKLGSIATTLSIWDLGGQERFDSFKESYMRGTAALVLVFDLVNFDSFSKLDYYLETARNGAGNVPVLLVGNKSDLETEEELGQVIQQSEIDDWMRLNQITDFMKTSAKTGENVRKAFEKLTIMSLVELGEKPRLGEVREEGFLFKVVVIGAAGVGKTSIVHRFTENVFLQDYKLTVGVDFIVKNLDVDEDLLPTDVLKNLNSYMEEIIAKKAAFPETKLKPTYPELVKKAHIVKEEQLIEGEDEIPPEKEIGVIYNKQMTRNTRNKIIFKIESEHFFTEPYVEITIKPEFPGCIVTPDKIVLDRAKLQEQIEFNITPISTGKMDDACIKILHDKKQRYLFHTPSKVISQAPTWILLVLSLIFLSLGPLFGQTYFVGVPLITPITLGVGGILLLASLIMYFLKKKKHTEQASFNLKE